MKKKKKEKQKTKKSKKHKSRKQSSSDSSDSGDVWEEAGISNRRKDDLQPCSSSSREHVDLVSPGLYIEKTAKREEWMSSSLLDVAFETTKSRDKKTKERNLETQRKEEEKKIEIYNARELNPDRKKMTHGHPVDQVITRVKREQNVVGDGGNSWIHKAYKRAKERANEENVPLENIVKQRWGSMEKLQALINVANRNQKSANSMSNTGQGTSSGWRKHANIPKLPPSCSENLAENVNKKCCEDSNSKEKLEKDKPATEESITPETKKLTMREALSEEEKNELNARLLRAELMGDDNLVAALKRKLDRDHDDVAVYDYPKQVQSKRKGSNTSNSDEEVILTRSDRHGNLYPIKLNTDVHEKSKRKKKIISTHDNESRLRLRYFEDDDITDLKTMVEEERLTSSDDQQVMLARLSGKHLGHTMGEDYTVDDMFVQACATKGQSNIENRRLKDKAIAEDRLQKKQLSSCRVCLENPNIAKHLIISIGINVYLSLPISASLTEGHCYIIPMKHVSAQTFLDEDVIQEVKKFKKGLTRMFSCVNEDVMFLETCKNLHDSHCIIECIPVPKVIGEMAPIYFKKAISEVGSEWSDNKKLITVSSTGGVNRAIPKGLPYFLIEFGLDGGFGHIIEEESFPHYFGKEVIGGMMDLEPRLWLKPPKESFELHKKKVFKFSDAWKEHDWTSKIT